MDMDGIAREAIDALRQIFVATLTLFFAQFVFKLTIPIDMTNGAVKLIGDVLLLWGFIALAYTLIKIIIYTICTLIVGLVSRLNHKGLVRPSEQSIYFFLNRIVFIGVVILAAIPSMKNVVEIAGIIGIAILALLFGFAFWEWVTGDTDQYLLEIANAIFSSIGKEKE